jgi:hypothetical protein
MYMYTLYIHDECTVNTLYFTGQMYIDAWSEYVGHEFGSSVYSKFLKHVGFLANTLPVAVRIPR